MNRIARAKVAQGMRPNKRVEARYVRDLRGIMAEVHKGTVKALEPQLRHDGPDLRIISRGHTDSAHGETLNLVSTKLVKYVRQTVGVAFDRMSDGVKKKHGERLPVRLIGVHPDASMLPVIATARDRNIALVENAAQDYAKQVRSVFDDPQAWGVRAEDLADELQRRDAIAAILEGRAAVSESRAELIARDQTLKLNGAINEAKQKSAGITQYTWSTSADERVRPDHAKLDGTVQTWGDPPVTNEATGDRNEPGQDFQCRCIAIPVIEELEGI